MGPTPAILSGQMDPPPVAPIAEMDFANGVYQLNEQDVAMSLLVRNASGPFSDITPVNDKGIFLHNDDSQSYGDVNDIYPPSIVATQTLVDVTSAMIATRGGLTMVCEFENEYIWNNLGGSSIPLVYMFSTPPFISGANYDKLIEWDCWEVYTTPPGYMSEGYAYGHPTTSFNGYTGGSPTAAGGYRRHRFAGTWGYDRGTGVGANRYRGAQSVDGSPQFVNVTFGTTPRDVDYDLKYFPPIHSIHIMGVGVDTLIQEGVDNGWWWWPPKGLWLRYFAIYPPRPEWAMPIISKQSAIDVRLAQIYAEVIHDKVV